MYLHTIANTKLYCCRFFMDNDGHVRLKYKHWSTDTDWLPSATAPQLELFKMDEEGHQLMPRDTPDLVLPDFDRKQCLADVKANLEKFKECLTASQYAWWEDFFTNPVRGQPTEWYLDNLQPQVHTPAAPIATGLDSSSPLAIAMRQERRIPEVNITTKVILYALLNMEVFLLL